MQIQKEKASREEEVRAGVISKSSRKQQNQKKKLKQKEKNLKTKLVDPQ